MRVPTLSQAAFRGLTFLLVTSLSLVSFVGSTEAGSFSVSPVKVELSTDKRIVALHVRNSGETEVSIQSELFRWTQSQGQSDLQSTRELIVAPPIFSIEPGATQVVRVGLRAAPDKIEERSFRLHLTEIPSPETQVINGLRIAMRLSLPLFVAPATDNVNFEMLWTAYLDRGEGVVLRAHNTGNGHGKITELNVSTRGNGEIQQAGNYYILPGSWREWTIPADQLAVQKGDFIDLAVTVNGKQISTRLPLE